MVGHPTAARNPRPLKELGVPPEQLGKELQIAAGYRHDHAAMRCGTRSSNRLIVRSMLPSQS